MKIIIFLLLGIITTALANVNPECAHRPKIQENCCDIPNLLEEKDFLSCFDELNKVAHNGLTMIARTMCEVECAYKTRNIFNNGSYNKTALAEMVNDKFNGSLTNWSSLFKIAFDKCEKDAEENEESLITRTSVPPYELQKFNCSPIPAYIFSCVKVYLTKACPANIWRDTPGCNELEQYLELCPDQFSNM